MSPVIVVMWDISDGEYKSQYHVGSGILSVVEQALEFNSFRNVVSSGFKSSNYGCGIITPAELLGVDSFSTQYVC
jgi:hypothetical protein